MISFKIQTSNNPSHIPSVFGIRLMTVLTGSMKPSINSGDIVVIKSIQPDKLTIGDVITYKKNNKTLITHRVINIENVDNKIFLKTKGDDNNVSDEYIIEEDMILGKMIFKIPKLGYIGGFIRTPLGFIIFIVLPLLMLSIKEIKKILLTVFRGK